MPDTTMRRAFATALLAVAAACESDSARQRRDDRSPVPAVTWQLQDSGVTVSLRGVSVWSGRIAWASGEEGVCLRTDDGGETWSRIAVPGGAERSWRDVHALDADTVLLMNAGPPAVLMRSEDRGRTWREVYRHADPDAFLDSVDFVGERGLCFGDPVDGRFVLIASADGGRSWQELPDAPVPRDGEAGFAASGTMVAITAEAFHVGTGGSAARVLIGSTTGATWRVAATPLRQGASSQGIFSLAFSELFPAIGVAVGGDYQREADARDTAAWTDDHGEKWRTPLRGPRGYRSAVAWVPGTRATFLAVGPSGADVTVDGGHTWAPSGDTGYHALALGADGRGWAVGSGGRVARVRVDG